MKLKHSIALALAIGVAFSAAYAFWRKKDTGPDRSTGSPSLPGQQRWSRQYLKKAPISPGKWAAAGPELTPEIRARILALFGQVNLPGPELVRGLYAITGDDAFPYLMPLILDRETPAGDANNMLATLVCADRVGGMKAYVEEVADGVYTGSGLARDPRFREPMTAIAVDSRYDPLVRSTAMIVLSHLGLDETGKAIALAAIDVREDPRVLRQGLQMAEKFAKELADEKRDELVDAALVVAHATRDSYVRAEALEVLNLLNIDPNRYDFLEGYASETDVEARRQRMLGLARAAPKAPDGFERLVEAYYVETDQSVREEALNIAPYLGAVLHDTNSLRWLVREIAPPTRTDTAVSVILSLRGTAIDDPTFRAKIIPLLKDVADGTQYGAEVRADAGRFVAELERLPAPQK